MAARSKPPATVERLTERLVDQAQAHGQEANLVLPAAAAASLLLGAGELHGPILRGIAALGDPVDTMLQLFDVQANCTAYLQAHLHPLTDLIKPAHRRPEISLSLTGMFTVLAEAELPALVETPQVAGDLLGSIYTQITSSAARSQRGAFYTPPSVAALMAMLIETRPGETWNDPCCGSGGLAIATVRAMRRGGQIPELVHWHLQDIDPTAVALAGIQLAAHGMPTVSLRCGNALTDPVDTP